MMKPLLLATFALLLPLGIAPPAAEAGDSGGSCGGTLVEYVPFNVGGEKVGQLQLYYNRSNGNNCAIMYHGGPTWGVVKDTGVLLARSRQRDANYRQAAFERKNFRYQAGPIRTQGDGWCVIAGGGIDYKGKHHTLYTRPHCG